MEFTSPHFQFPTGKCCTSRILDDEFSISLTLPFDDNNSKSISLPLLFRVYPII
jgi:hypothetical protein